MSKHSQPIEDRQAWMRARHAQSPAEVRPDRTGVAVERHYTPKDLGAMWGFSPETIQSMFRDEPGVLKKGTLRTKLRIPHSVAQRVHERLSA